MLNKFSQSFGNAMSKFFGHFKHKQTLMSQQEDIIGKCLTLAPFEMELHRMHRACEMRDHAHSKAGILVSIPAAWWSMRYITHSAVLLHRQQHLGKNFVSYSVQRLTFFCTVLHDARGCVDQHLHNSSAVCKRSNSSLSAVQCSECKRCSTMRGGSRQCSANEYSC